MQETYELKARRFVSEWLPAPFMPPRDLTIQSSGICFTKEHLVVLVLHEKGWLLPGGYPEGNETLEQALIREIDEEACAAVVDFEYLGSVKSRELTAVKAPNLPLFYQARYWVLLQQKAFEPRFEIQERKQVEPAAIVDMLRWPARGLSRLILDDALAVDRRRNVARTTSS